MALFNFVFDLAADGSLANDSRLVRFVSNTGFRGRFFARTVGALRILRFFSLSLCTRKRIHLRNLPRPEGSYCRFAGNIWCSRGIQQASPQTR